VRDDRGHLSQRAGHLPQRAVHQHQRVVRAAAAASARAQRPERDRAAGGGARTGTEAVGERDPHPVEILDEVEPVARDVVAGQHVARELAAADPGDARREQALLDLGRRERLLAPLASRERIGVAVGERNRGRGLARDLGERATWPAEREHHARRAPAEPERDDLDATAMREPGAQLGQTGGVQLRSDRQRHLDPLGETVRSGNAQQMRAIDVDDVQPERNVGDPLRLRHELLGQERRSDDVEDVDAIEQHRGLSSEPTGGQRLVGGLHGRGRSVLPDRLEQRVSVGEVPVERGPRHAGGRRDVRSRRRGRLLEQAAARLDDPPPRPLRARAPTGHAEQWT
jgi:hypothetical protein